MKRIGTDLLKKSKASHEDNISSGRKDILSILIQANTMEDLSGQMPEEDVLDRVYNFETYPKSSIYLTPTYRDPYFHYRWSRNNKVHTFVPM